MNKRIKKKKGLSKITVRECWSLDYTLAKYILPRLIKYKEINTMSYPLSFNGTEEWHKVIDKMIWSFDIIVNDKWWWDQKDHIENHERYLEGMNLFAKHFIDLWD